jgi:hypothetical protein
VLRATRCTVEDFVSQTIPPMWHCFCFFQRSLISKTILTWESWIAD